MNNMLIGDSGSNGSTSSKPSLKSIQASRIAFGSTTAAAYSNNRLTRSASTWRCRRYWKSVAATETRQHFLYFLPLPHGQGSFLPVLFMEALGSRFSLVGLSHSNVFCPVTRNAREGS